MGYYRIPNMYVRVIKLANQFEKKLEQWAKSKSAKPHPDELLLLKHDIIPIVKPTKSTPPGAIWFGEYAKQNYGTHSSWLGSGIGSNVWEVIYKGKRCAAKVTGEHDASKYIKLQEIYESAPKEVKKHLPRVFEIIKDNVSLPTRLMTDYPKIRGVQGLGGNLEVYIVITEILEPLNDYVNELLYKGSAKHEDQPKYKFLDEPTIYNVISHNYKSIIDSFFESFASDPNLDSNGFDELKLYFNNYQNKIQKDISEYLYFSMQKDSLTSVAKEKLKNHITQLIQRVPNCPQDLADNFLSEIHRFINSINFPEQGDQYLTFRSLWKENFFLNLPETKSLMKALIYLRNNYNFIWGDLGDSNLMERPGTRDIVISDIGGFSSLS